MPLQPTISTPQTASTASRQRPPDMTHYTPDPVLATLAESMSMPSDGAHRGSKQCWTFLVDVSRTMGNPAECSEERCSRLGFSLAAVVAMIHRQLREGDEYMVREQGFLTES